MIRALAEVLVLTFLIFPQPYVSLRSLLPTMTAAGILKNSPSKRTIPNIRHSSWIFKKDSTAYNYNCPESSEIFKSA